MNLLLAPVEILPLANLLCAPGMSVFFSRGTNLLKHVFLEMMVSHAALGLQIIAHVQDTILVLPKTPSAQSTDGLVHNELLRELLWSLVKPPDYGP